MEYLRRLEPTPDALRNGRVRLSIFAVVLVVLLVIIVFVPGISDDRNLLAITAATGVAFAGDCIAYLGQPSLTRYRLGLLVTTVGIIASFVILFTNPFS